jgi:tetratricopeptide (TPR) repeat protein
MPKSNFRSGSLRTFKQTNVGENQTINIYLLGEIKIIVGILLMMVSPFTLAYMPFSIVLAVSGLLLIIPGTIKLIEHVFRTDKTSTVQSIALLAVVLLNLPFAIAFGRERARLTDAHRTELRQEQAARLNEQQRKDSLNTCLLRIDSLYREGEADKALLELDKADLLAETPGEQADVDQVRIGVSLVKATKLMKRHQYNMAIDLLGSVHELDSNDTDVLYMRARCYVETNHMANAAHDAKSAMDRGHKDAGKLYESINPIRKQVAYTCTLCRDGTYSNAKGSGACSHHGGVEQWDYLVYEMGRQYE